MTTATIQKELLANERKFWDAIRDADSDKLASMTADTYTFVMGDGVFNLAVTSS